MSLRLFVFGALEFNSCSLPVMAPLLQASLDPIRNALDEHFITQFDNQVVPLPAAPFLFDKENLRCI